MKRIFAALLILTLLSAPARASYQPPVGQPGDVQFNSAGHWGGVFIGTNSLLGKTSGNPVSITLGSGLTLTGTTLSATATGDVSSVSNSNGTLVISPTTGDVLASLNLAHANIWTGQQTFNTSAIILGTTTASTALVTDGSKNVVSSSTTATELGYVHGVTSALQTQLNAKQASGSYLTALTGDGTASGPGSAALTLSTVNSNVGSFGSSAAIPNFTVDGKGRITAAGSGAVIAPAGTLTGSTLASGVTASSLTSFGASPVLGTPASVTLTNGTGLPLTGLASQATNTVLVNATSGSASPTAQAIGSCSASTSALTWTTNSGFGCHTISGGGGGTPGGSNNQVQFNNGGSFGGSSGMTYLSSTGTLTATHFSGPLTGNATTASALVTPRAINGVNFDGSAPITVTAAASTLTGTTLASGVVTSSITTLGSDASLPGNPTTTTQTTGNSSTRIATTAFAGAAVKADTRCYDFYFTTPGGSVEPTGSNPPPAFKDFPFAFTISQIYLSVYTSGAGNAVVNGGFGSSSVWTLGAGVTIDTVDNWAAFSAVTGAGLTQTPAHALTPSWPYVVTYTVSGLSAGSVYITVGGTNGTTRSANGTYTETITTSADPTIIFTGTGFTGNISAVSATSYATFDIQNNGVSILDASRLTIDNSTTDSRNNVTNPQPTIVLPTVLSKNTISVVVIKDDDQNAMAGGDMVICGSKP